MLSNKHHVYKYRKGLSARKGSQLEKNKEKLANMQDSKVKSYYMKRMIKKPIPQKFMTMVNVLY